jgi:hypothetical protein
VVVAPETLATIEKRRSLGQSLWRVSSTLFSHINSDQELRPLEGGPWPASDDGVARFPPILAGDQVMEELRAIKLGQQEEKGREGPVAPSLS